MGNSVTKIEKDQATYDLVMDYGLLLIKVSDTEELKKSRVVGEVFVKIANEWERSQFHGDSLHRATLQMLLEAAAEAVIEMFQESIAEGIEDD